MSLILLSFAFIFNIGLAKAAEEEKPQIARMVHGPAHEKLDRLAGDWKTRRVIRWGGKETVVEGEETYAWIEPTRVWLKKEVAKTDHPVIGEMNGLELWAYDGRSQEYVKYWFDSQSTESFPHRGKWIDDDTLEMTGMIVWNGRNMYLKDSLTFDGSDKLVWRHFQSWDTDDAFEESSVVEYERQ